MIFLHYLSNIFAGLFLCNAFPHLASGLRGEPFPTPFAKPRGVGLSSPLTNTLWGSGNLAVAIALLGISPIVSVWSLQMLFTAVGFVFAGIPTSIHFGRVRQNRMNQN
jgi:hypothetical protein